MSEQRIPWVQVSIAGAIVFLAEVIVSSTSQGWSFFWAIAAIVLGTAVAVRLAPLSR